MTLWIPRVLADGSLDRPDEFRCPDNVLALALWFLVRVKQKERKKKRQKRQIEVSIACGVRGS